MTSVAGADDDAGPGQSISRVATLGPLGTNGPKQSPPRPADWVSRASRARHDIKSMPWIRAPDQRVTWGTHRLLHVVEGGPGSRCGANKARLRRSAPPDAARPTGRASVPSALPWSCPDAVY